MLKKSFVVFIMLVAISAFVGAGSASAKSVDLIPLNTSTSSSLDFSSLQSTCAVIGIHLEGAVHTVTCRMLKLKSSGVHPLFNRDNACDPSYDDMVIFNYGYNQVLCFDGAGYAGVSINQVNEVDDVAPTNSNIVAYGEWFRWYSPGTFTSLTIGHSKVFGGGNTNILVTQICIGTVTPNGCL